MKMSKNQDDEAREVLLSLWNKGPAMPVELAAQCYSFPEDVAAVLKSLGTAGLVETRPIARSKWGGALVYLSDQGRYYVIHDLLRDRA
jgi:DNA-binding MarR family transcriptional regulator